MGDKMVQLDFFEKDEVTMLNDKFEKLEESCEKVRKGQFAKLGALQKKYDELFERLDRIEKHICCGV